MAVCRSSTPRDRALVVNDREVADLLEQLVANRRLHEIPYLVRRVNVDVGLRSCHLIYVSGLNDVATAELL
jgi:hypothetical protein